MFISLKETNPLERFNAPKLHENMANDVTSKHQVMSF